MNEITAEKFADLMAKCAVSGDSVDLRKEAAAQELVKSASPWIWALPAAGALAGGAAGYFGTEDEKRKKRNALYGLITGGTLGLGGALATTGLNIVGKSTDNMSNANDEAAKQMAIISGKTKSWYRQPDGKKTWWGSVADTIPGFSAGESGSAFSPLEGGVYGNYNPYNVPGRGAGAVLGYLTGGAISDANVAARNNLAGRASDLHTVHQISPPKPTKGGRPPRNPTQTTDVLKSVVDRIRDTAQAPRPRATNTLQAITNWFRDRVNYRPYTNAALDVMGATRFQGWGNLVNTAGNMARNPNAARQIFTNYMNARRQAAEHLRMARNIGDVARTGAIPGRRDALSDVVAAVEETVTNPRSQPNRSGGRPLTAPRANTVRMSRERLLSALSDAQRARAGQPGPYRRQGRFGSARLGGGAAGLVLSNPNIMEWLFNRIAAAAGYADPPPAQ